MLDNLRGMAVFASVVKHGSFSAAAKELGITTSAVSQQIRTLENDLGVVLLHRSTRKLSLTEVGESLYESAVMMVRAAQEAKENVGQLRDEILGSLKVATTPNLARLHIVPALSAWISQHEDLSLKVVTNTATVDMIGERVDLAVGFQSVPMATDVVLLKLSQMLIASKRYLESYLGSADEQLESGNLAPKRLDELKPCDLAAMHLVATHEMGDTLSFADGDDLQLVRLDPKQNRTQTNDQGVALSLVKNHQGVLLTNVLDAYEALQDQELTVILPRYTLPSLYLTVKTLSKDQQTVKIKKCLEALGDYFDDLLVEFAVPAT